MIFLKILYCNARLLLWYTLIVVIISIQTARADNTAATCTDGLDNDGDGFIDVIDPDCVLGGFVETMSCELDAFLVQTTTSQWDTINLVDGVAVSADDNFPTRINAIGYNVKDNRIWGVDRLAGNRLVVSTRDAAGDWTTTVTPVIAGLSDPNFFTGDVNADGELHVVRGSGGTRTVSVIDLDPASVTYLTIIRTYTVTHALDITVADWAFNPIDDQLYGVGQDAQLYRYNPLTGARDDLGPAGVAANNHGAVYFDVDGFFYVSDNLTGVIDRLDLRTPPVSDYDETQSVFFSNGPSSSFNDGARCSAAPLPIDMGDVPDSYSTLLSSDGPRHLIADQSGTITDLHLGAAIDDEVDGQPTMEADGDGADDDGISFPIYATGASTYTVSATLTNNTGTLATLCGWIDFDLNGVFDVDESTCTTVNNGATSTSLVFDVSSFNLDGSANYYARFRICTIANECTTPTGGAMDGEVEDYLLAIDTLPVTLSHFDSNLLSNKVEVNWGTSSELFNVGFQLWGLDGADGKWEKLHNWLVRSGSGNAVEPQSYLKTARIPTSIDTLIALGISSVDSDGTEHYYGPFELGKSYGDLSQLEPIAWNHIRSEMDANMLARGYIKDRVNGYRKASPVTLQTNDSSDTQTVVEFSVSKTGMYRITAQELLTAGIEWRDVRRGDLALLDHNGDAVVRYVWARGSGKGLNKTLGNKGEIYFYGRSPDESEGLYTDSSVYRLVLDRYQALQAPVQGKQGIQDGYSDYYMEHAEVENDALYVLNSTADDPWLSRVVLGYPDQPSLYGLQIPIEADALWDQASTLTLGLGRSSGLAFVDADLDGHQDPEHIVEGLVLSSAGSNGLLNLATETAVGSGEWDIEFSIPANTPLTINDGHVIAGGGFSAGNGYAFSEIHVDSIGLVYARPYVAKTGDDHLVFTGPNKNELGYEVTVPDTGGPWVFGSDGSNLVRIALESQNKQTNTSGAKERVVRFATLPNINNTALHYWVSGKGGFLSVADLTVKSIPNSPALLAQAAGANLLIVSHPAFLGDPLTGYAAFKQSQGYSVAIIDYLEVVDAFGGGQPGPQGLTNYLSQVEKLGLLDHVLLVGGSTYDHTDIQNTGAITFIPGHYGESSYSKFTVSDVPYISTLDNLLFATIGRWPVRTENDLQAIINKSIAWSNRDRSDNSALLIAEHTVVGENIDFGDALDGVAQVLPADYRQTRVYVDQVAADNNLNLPGQLTQALTLSKTAIIDELNKTPDVVLYNGHASTRQLSNQNLFKSGDIAQITADNAEVWLPMSCYVTFYESTHVNTLAHQLLFTGNAASITGAMLLSNQSENIQVGQSILDQTLHANQSMGQAINDYKSSQDNPKLNINWSLLGDPTHGL